MNSSFLLLVGRFKIVIVILLVIIDIIVIVIVAVDILTVGQPIRLRRDGRLGDDDALAIAVSRRDELLAPCGERHRWGGGGRRRGRCRQCRGGGYLAKHAFRASHAHNQFHRGELVIRARRVSVALVHCVVIAIQTVRARLTRRAQECGQVGLRVGSFASAAHHRRCWRRRWRCRHWVGPGRRLRTWLVGPCVSGRRRWRRRRVEALMHAVPRPRPAVHQPLDRQVVFYLTDVDRNATRWTLRADTRQIDACT